MLDIIYDVMSPAELVRERRGRLGLTQRQLALRAENVAERRPLDAERIFAELDAHAAEYVLIGGIAVQVHGHVRMTNDVLRERALAIALGDRRIAVASRDDPIKMKRATGRPVDLADIAALTEPEHRRSQAEQA